MAGILLEAIESRLWPNYGYRELPASDQAKLMNTIKFDLEAFEKDFGNELMVELWWRVARWLNVTHEWEKGNPVATWRKKFHYWKKKILEGVKK